VRSLLLTLITLASLLHAGELHLSLQHVCADGHCGTISTARVEPGVSGFVVRHFTPEHSAIITNAVAGDYDANTSTLNVAFSPYSGLRQNSLPKGLWQPRIGDEVVLAFAYSRGILIAPTQSVYHKLTEKIDSIEWIHPDALASFLSYKGHPTPLKKDLGAFCTVVTAGVLLLYLDDALFTLDCQSLAVLQITRADLAYAKPELPFYSRVETIDANWFGKGSGRLETYEPHYFELMVENNPHSVKLYDYIQSHPSRDKALLDNFDLGAHR